MKNKNGTKYAVSTLAIKVGLMCKYDGQIFNEDTLLEDLTKALKENGYTTDPNKALVKVRCLSERLSYQAYGC